MDPWTPRPNRADKQASIPLLRSKPGRTFAALCVSPEIVGAYTHFWKGRTALCTYPECEPCHAHRAARWYGYLHVWTPATNATALLEITPSCVTPLEEYLAQFGTLRGAKITIARANHKINSRVVLTAQASAYALDKLPATLDVRAHLRRIWETTATLAADAAAPNDNGHARPRLHA